MVFKNIVSIAAAPGWVAVAGSTMDGSGDAEYPLVAWAVERVEADWAAPGEQRVVGVVYAVPGDGVADAESHVPNFSHYAYRPE